MHKHDTSSATIHPIDGVTTRRVCGVLRVRTAPVPTTADPKWKMFNTIGSAVSEGYITARGIPFTPYNPSTDSMHYTIGSTWITSCRDEPDTFFDDMARLSGNPDSSIPKRRDSSASFAAVPPSRYDSKHWSAESWSAERCRRRTAVKEFSAAHADVFSKMEELVALADEAVPVGYGECPGCGILLPENETTGWTKIQSACGCESRICLTCLEEADSGRVTCGGNCSATQTFS